MIIKTTKGEIDDDVFINYWDRNRNRQYGRILRSTLSVSNNKPFISVLNEDSGVDVITEVDDIFGIGDKITTYEQP